jgi:metal-sulfur cluster biosynthetic enzyme
MALNENPTVYKVVSTEKINSFDFDDEEEVESLSASEVFECIRHLNDPEHPLTLEQLNVLQVANIHVKNDDTNQILIQFTPTIPHCSMATLIGLCIRVKLGRSLATKYKVTIQIYPGSHQSEVAVNKQLNDKERVCAALENQHLLDIVNKCIQGSDRQ